MIRRMLNFTGRTLYLLFTRHKGKLAAGLAVLLFLFWISLPRQLFQNPTSTVVLDRNGNLLGARIAEDEQWRFPAADTVPFRFKAALLTFEDRKFYYHSGVDPNGFARAFLQNLRNGEVVSGGSTLSMQVIRLSRPGSARNMLNKMTEAILALRLEMSYSKDQILAMYVSNAPFGGNVVGLDAAAWRYFGRSASQLSWGEAATLAVLPNSPSLVHPGRNRRALKEKRDRLLDRLLAEGFMDAATCKLSKQEPLPEAPVPLPNIAPHLLDRAQAGFRKTPGAPTRIITTLDGFLQTRVADILQQHVTTLKENGIHNAAAIIIEVQTGDVLAYVGNVNDPGNAHQNSVDVVRSPRSTGSILKPLLYASMLSDGDLLPTHLIADIPTLYGSYSPKNYSQDYDGAVPAHRALARSLNVPAIRMLHSFGQLKFYERMKAVGMTTLTQPASHYGLSLILGGAEATLWDLAGVYASMARTVNNYHLYNGKYDRNEFSPPNIDLEKSRGNGKVYKPELTASSPLGAGACFLTLSAMEELTRPDEEGNWEDFDARNKIAWKTGTSYGYRDAWSIGCTPQYVVAVWVGNADGEGRPGLIGVEAAAPVMFSLFDLLRSTRGRSDRWFEMPYDDLRKVAVCPQSGYRPVDACGTPDSAWVTLAGLRTGPCPYHKEVHLDPTGQFQVTADCEAPANMVHKGWFVLPPAQEVFYKKKHADYSELPPWRDDCLAAMQQLLSSKNMEFIYPRTQTKIFIPVKLDGTPGTAVFEAAHRDPNAKIHWHLDNQYLGSTEKFHQMALNPKAGTHIVTLVDDTGEELKQKFEILTKEE